MSDSSSYGLGGKLVVAVILALLAGYIWACVEEKQSPLALLMKFLPAEEPAAPQAAPPPKEVGTETSPPAPAPEARPPAEGDRQADAPAGPQEGPRQARRGADREARAAGPRARRGP